MKDTLEEIAMVVVEGIRGGMGREQIVGSLGIQFGRDVDIPEDAFKKIKEIVNDLLVARETAERKRGEKDDADVKDAEVIPLFGPREPRGGNK